MLQSVILDIVHHLGFFNGQTVFLKLDASISRRKGREHSYTVGPVGDNKKRSSFQNVVF